MIAIRPEQYQAFEAAEWRRFLASAVEHVREGLPELAAPLADAEIVRRAEVATARAETYGLVTEYDILCFLDASFLLDDEFFDVNPKFSPIRGVLLDGTLESDDKAEQTLVLAVQQCPHART